MSYAMLLLPEHLGRSLVVAVALVAVYATALMRHRRKTA